MDDDIPPVIQAWIGQLLDPMVVDLVRLAGSEQVDVRLSASRGRVRARPMLVLNGGPSEMTPTA